MMWGREWRPDHLPSQQSQFVAEQGPQRLSAREEDVVVEELLQSPEGLLFSRRAWWVEVQAVEIAVGHRAESFELDVVGEVVEVAIHLAVVEGRDGIHFRWLLRLFAEMVIFRGKYGSCWGTEYGFGGG